MKTPNPSRKGIILAGGSGTRLYPITRAISKQLLPIYDKPMIYYPLSTLMLAGNSRHSADIYTGGHRQFRACAGGWQPDRDRDHVCRTAPARRSCSGLPDRPTIRRNGDPVTLILGDNIFYGQGFQSHAQRMRATGQGATVFAYPVKDPRTIRRRRVRRAKDVYSRSRKSRSRPKSHYAVTGLYFYDNQVVDIAAGLTPSARGELEITDVNRVYLDRRPAPGRIVQSRVRLARHRHDRVADPGSQLRRDHRIPPGVKIACIEEVAYRMGFITADQVRQVADTIPNDYGRYLKDVARELTVPFGQRT